MSAKVLAVFAHPDDAELCMGGTLAAYAAAGREVHVVIASLPDQRERRIDESIRGAQLLGADVHFLEREGTWQVEDLPVYRLVSMIDEFVSRLEPDMLFTHWHGDAHHDHALVARAVHSALRRSKADFFLVEQPNAFAPEVTPMEADTYFDITEFLEVRLAAIDAHQSQQVGSRFRELVINRARFHGNRIGCDYAEAFKCVRQRLRARSVGE